MHLRVVTPMGSIVDTAVTQVTAPGELGALGILPGHRPLLTALDIGVLTYKPLQGEAQHLAINTGYMQVADDDVIVITETAERPEHIDVARAQAARDRADQALKATDAERLEEQARLTRTRRRAENRLVAAKLKKREIPP